jgi:hypothetical protein
MVRYRGKLTCCDHVHVRPCGLVPGNEVAQEPICACGCSGYDERCGGSEWWLLRDANGVPVGFDMGAFLCFEVLAKVRNTQVAFGLPQGGHV